MVRCSVVNFGAASSLYCSGADASRSGKWRSSAVFAAGGGELKRRDGLGSEMPDCVPLSPSGHRACRLNDPYPG
jgi:hypothetical protein